MSLSSPLLAAFYVGAGTLHFTRTRMYERTVPAFLPAHRELVLVSGVAEIAGGLAVLPQRTRRAAGWWLIGLLVAVFPANVNMALDPEGTGASGVPRWALWLRLPVQGLLIVWADRATRD
jgi:uncharacterized membrane protein